ncbi:MAG: LysM peptidoglycan-binding domain-containing protein [Nocardioides sp.]
MSTIAIQPSRVREGAVRLTRRGRLVVFALSLFVILAAGVLLSSGSVATERPEPTEVVMVGTGETLWDIAAERAGDGDAREMMAHILRLNSLDSAALDAGQRLRVPVNG